jgi:hypothetical protein
LPDGASQRLQGGLLRKSFDSFGDDDHVEFLAEGNDRASDGRILRVVVDAGDKALIDLEGVNRELLEVGQARPSGPEVVDRDPDAECSETFEEIGGLVDGLGGADQTRGSGLRSLNDRVEAIGGRLTVESPASRGTRLWMTIPA